MQNRKNVAVILWVFDSEFHAKANWTFKMKLWVLGECGTKSINFVLKDSECEFSPDCEVLGGFCFAIVCISQEFCA